MTGTSNARRLEILRRDAWHCRLCHEPVFFSPTLKLLERRSPGHGYYHQHGKVGPMVSLLARRCAMVHVVRASTADSTGHVTACWECVSRLPKGDSTVEVLPIHDGGPWDGFSSLYPRLASERDQWCRLLDGDD